MKNVMFYETYFDHYIPELWFSGKPKVGDRGYSEYGAHMHRHIEFQYLLTGSEIFTVDGEKYCSDDNFIFIFPYQIHSNHFNRDCQSIPTPLRATQSFSPITARSPRRFREARFLSISTGLYDTQTISSSTRIIRIRSSFFTTR